MMIQSGTDHFVTPEERNRKIETSILFYSIHVTTIDDRSSEDCGVMRKMDVIFYKD